MPRPSAATRHGGRRYRLFENGEATLVCGGIGAEAARRATEAVIREVDPVRVISVGFAGALDASLQVGHVFEPRTVINAADGVRTEIGGGAVSFPCVKHPRCGVSLSKRSGLVHGLRQ